MAFFLSISTIDTYDPNRYLSPKYITSKIIGTILLFKMSQELTQMVYLMASFYNPKDKRK